MPHLARAIADSALLRGTFTLRSGRTSSFYLDKYLFSTRPDILRPIAQRLAQKVRAQPIDRLAGAELGGIPLVTALSLETGLPSLFIRAQKKSYGTAKQIEGTLSPGDRILLIEDVATTGGQALEAIQILRDAAARVVAVIAVIDRQEGARESIAAAGIPFDALFTKADLGITD